MEYAPIQKVAALSIDLRERFDRGDRSIPLEFIDALDALISEQVAQIPSMVEECPHDDIDYDFTEELYGTYRGCRVEPVDTAHGPGLRLIINTTIRKDWDSNEIHQEITCQKCGKVWDLDDFADVVWD